MQYAAGNVSANPDVKRRLRKGKLRLWYEHDTQDCMEKKFSEVVDELLFPQRVSCVNAEDIPRDVKRM